MRVRGVEGVDEGTLVVFQSKLRSLATFAANFEITFPSTPGSHAAFSHIYPLSGHTRENTRENILAFAARIHIHDACRYRRFMQAAQVK